MDYRRVVECRACCNKTLLEVLNLKEQPLANSYHKGEQQSTFPLCLDLCDTCYHLQLNVVVNPDLMFKHYLYVSGTSQTLRDYFDWFVTLVNEKPGKILDIACNDGSQLDSFKKLGWTTYGVDPAKNLYELSSKNHNITCNYWSSLVASQLKTTFDIITAQNVFAHTDNIYRFLEACKKVMKSTTKIYIQTSQADMIINNEFDTIYHEHLSFFSLKSMLAIAKRSGLCVTDVVKNPIHGNSYIFTLGFGEEKESVAKLLKKENSEGRYSLQTYKDYASKCHKVVNELKASISSYRDQGFVVAGYGAAAKGNTLLNFGQISLDFIVDDNKLKCGLLTPGRDIAIHSSEFLKTIEGDMVIVPLAWNFYTEIYKKVKKYRPTNNDIFIKYFPELSING